MKSQDKEKFIWVASKDKIQRNKHQEQNDIDDKAEREHFTHIIILISIQQVKHSCNEYHSYYNRYKSNNNKHKW